MKRALFLFTIILTCACSEQKKEDKEDEREPSLQERAEMLAAEYTKGLLYIPESYDPIETKIDSAFTSVLNDVEIYSAASQILEYESEHRFTILASPTKRESKKLQSCVDLIKTRASEMTNEFCGWQIYHRCRANNRAEEPGFITSLYFTDKDLSEVIIAYDLSDDNPFESNIDDYVDLIEGIIEGEYDTKYQYNPDRYNTPGRYSSVIKTNRPSLISTYNERIKVLADEYDDLSNTDIDSDCNEIVVSSLGLMAETEQSQEDHLDDIVLTDEVQYNYNDKLYDYDDYTDIDEIDIDIESYSDVNMLI